MNQSLALLVLSSLLASACATKTVNGGSQGDPPPGEDAAAPVGTSPGGNRGTGLPFPLPITDSGPVPRCFDTFAPRLPLGPKNAVFAASGTMKGDITNYANHVVFKTLTWELNANFPTRDADDDQTLNLPAKLSLVRQNVGELRVAPECRNEVVAGLTVRIFVLWKLVGATSWWPTHGLSLGKADGTWLPDATKSYTRGQPIEHRQINTLNEVVLEHTFAAGDSTRATDLVLRVWLLGNFHVPAFPTMFYVNRVEWQ